MKLELIIAQDEKVKGSVQIEGKADLVKKLAEAIETAAKQYDQSYRIE